MIFITISLLFIPNAINSLEGVCYDYANYYFCYEAIFFPGVHLFVSLEAADLCKDFYIYI